jgi:hypothetical protein
MNKAKIRSKAKIKNKAKIRKKRIFIIGSTCYKDKMLKHQQDLIKKGYDVRLPSFDYSYKKELSIITENKNSIFWADEIHMFYDGRSYGTIFDFGMLFYAMKPLKIIYLNEKTIVNAMKQYEEVMRLFEKEV